jgi:hypothetical protein
MASTKLASTIVVARRHSNSISKSSGIDGLEQHQLIRRLRPRCDSSDDSITSILSRRHQHLSSIGH